MKQLVSDDQTLIRSQPARPGRKKFDPWPSHGGGTMAIGIASTGSGLYLLHFEASLIDSEYYEYPLEGWYDAAGVTAAYEAAGAWVPPGYHSPAFGEWWNYVGRYLVTDKVPIADWNDWLLAR